LKHEQIVGGLVDGFYPFIDQSSCHKILFVRIVSSLDSGGPCTFRPYHYLLPNGLLIFKDEQTLDSNHNS